MKTRKQIIQDIDKIWGDHINFVIESVDTDKRQRSIGSKLYSYFKKLMNCDCEPCGCNVLGKIYCKKHYGI